MPPSTPKKARTDESQAMGPIMHKDSAVESSSSEDDIPAHGDDSEGSDSDVESLWSLSMQTVVADPTPEPSPATGKRKRGPGRKPKEGADVDQGVSHWFFFSLHPLTVS